MKLAFAVLALITACGGGQVPPGGAVAPKGSPPARAGGAPAPADALPTLDDLALRAPGLAPGMSEATRGEEAARPKATRDVVRAETKDTCARVAFVADAPVRASLETSGGDVLAAAPRGTSGVLGAEGPVCVRKGDVVRVVFASETGARVRWIAWRSP